jgi:hypothetical protein
MLGSRNRDQLEFMVCGSLRDLVPDDHVLGVQSRHLVDRIEDELIRL